MNEGIHIEYRNDAYTKGHRKHSAELEFKQSHLLYFIGTKAKINEILFQYEKTEIDLPRYRAEGSDVPTLLPGYQTLMTEEK